MQSSERLGIPHDSMTFGNPFQTLLVSHMIVEESWLTLLHKVPSVHQGLLAFFFCTLVLRSQHSISVRLSSGLCIIAIT